MRFIHMADVHLADNFNFKSSLSKSIRDNTWKSFKNILMDNKTADFALISGDLYEKNHFTSQDFNKLFEIIEDFNKDIFYVTGNHDYLDSYTRFFLEKSPENFHYFDSNKVSIKEKDGIRIYGISYNDRIFSKNINFKIPLDRDFFNIFLGHGDYNVNNSNYLNLNREINNFDYVAYGHIHKKMKENALVYPGSIEPFDFSHTGDHGYVLYDRGEIEFINSSLLKFYEFNINYDDYTNLDELIKDVEKNLLEKVNFIRLNISNIDERSFTYIRNNLNCFYLDILSKDGNNKNDILSLYPNSLLSKFHHEYEKNDNLSVGSLSYELGLSAILRSKND